MIATLYDDNDEMKLGYAQVNASINWEVESRHEPPVIWLEHIVSISTDDHPEVVPASNLTEEHRRTVELWVMRQIEQDKLTSLVIEAIENW